MKVLTFITRTLLGVIFVASGASGMLPGHTQTFNTERAKQFMAVMQATPYGDILFAGQILCGLLLLASLFAPMALIVLGAYLFNIFMFDIFIEPEHVVFALALAVLWLLTAFRYRAAFHPLFQSRFSAPGAAQ